MVKDIKRNIDFAASSLFEKMYENASLIDYNHKWTTTDTYRAYVGAVCGSSAPVLHPGDLVKSISPGGRRMLVLGTELGNVVIYTPLLYTQEVLWLNVSLAMQDFICSDAFSNKQNKGVFSRSVKCTMLQLMLGNSRTMSVARRFNKAPKAIRAQFLQSYNDSLNIS